MAGGDGTRFVGDAADLADREMVKRRLRRAGFAQAADAAELVTCALNAARELAKKWSQSGKPKAEGG